MSDRRPVGLIALWILTLTSLALNIVIITQLTRVRAAALESLDEALVALRAFRAETFTYDFVVEDVLDINTEMPIEETIPVEIDETIAVDTTVTVPLDAGPLGTYDVNVPLRTNIPVELDVPIEIDQTFPIRAAVPVSLTVPVAIAIEETPLDGALADLEAQLEALAAELDGSRE